MKRDLPDFFLVAPHHIKMHDRLSNWGKWSHSPAWSRTQPMFRLYVSDEHWQGQEARTPVDGLDATKIQKGVSQLPEGHRKALAWSYIFKTNPRSFIKKSGLGVNVEGLAALVTDARTMLINRRV